MSNIKKRVILYIAIGLITLLIVGGIIMNGTVNTNDPVRLLSLGEKYLLELDYEQALVQFLKVIELDPMNPRGYTGAAEAYIGLGEQEKAIEVLEKGLELLPNDTAIRAMLESIGGDTVAKSQEGDSSEDDMPLRESQVPGSQSEASSQSVPQTDGNSITMVDSVTISFTATNNETYTYALTNVADYVSPKEWDGAVWPYVILYYPGAMITPFQDQQTGFMTEKTYTHDDGNGGTYEDNYYYGEILAGTTYKIEDVFAESAQGGGIMGQIHLASVEDKVNIEQIELRISNGTAVPIYNYAVPAADNISSMVEKQAAIKIADIDLYSVTDNTDMFA
jgi:tetratricopeptide (TPR) repeat protein